MPRKCEIESLVKLCLSCIKETIENSKFAVNLPSIQKDDKEILVSLETNRNELHQLIRMSITQTLFQNLFSLIVKFSKFIFKKCVQPLRSRKKSLRFSPEAEN
jgi:hypothetical protein